MKPVRWALLLFGFCALQVQAQDQDLQSQFTTNKRSRSMLLAGVETSTTSYINTATKDSSGTSSYVALYATWHHKSNFGLRAKTYLLTKGDNNGFYLTSLSAYYANYFAKLIPVISYTRFIQHDNASIPYSPLVNEMYAELRYPNPLVEPAVGLDVGFGNDSTNNDEAVSDVNVFAGVSHWFIWQAANNQTFVFVPTLQLNAGTDRYYRFLKTTRYVSQNRPLTKMMYGSRGGNGNGSGNGGGGNEGSGGTTTETYMLDETNEFNVSNLELNGYVQYSIGRFGIAPSGSIYFPLRGDNRSVYGYWQVNLTVRIQ